MIRDQIIIYIYMDYIVPTHVKIVSKVAHRAHGIVRENFGNIVFGNKSQLSQNLHNMSRCPGTVC